MDARHLLIAIVSLGAAAVTAACIELSDVVDGICGNRVVETSEGEDCDGDAPEGALCASAGTEHACHYVDDDEHDCPEGWSAGADLRCRKPTGTFDAPSETIRGVGGVNAVAADLDGDGQLDIAAESGDRGSAIVVYLDRSGERYSGEPRPLTSAGIAVGDLTGDSIADVATPVAVLGWPGPDGIAVLRGQTDRTFLGKLYASSPYPGEARYVTIPAAAIGLDPELAIEGLLAIQSGEDVECGASYCACLDGTDCVAPSPLPPPPPAPPMGAPGWLGGRSAHDEASVALAARDSADVLVATVGAGQELGPFVALPIAGSPPVRAISDPVMRDLDGDDVADLGIVAASGACPARFTLAGPSSAWTPLSELVPASQWTAGCAALFGSPDVALAIAHLNDDRVPDYVRFRAPAEPYTTVYLSREGAAFTGDVEVTHVAVDLSQRWLEVAVGDVNGDGRDDLVAAAQDDNAVDVALGGSVAPLAIARVKLPGHVRQIAIADVDGDGAGDVVTASSNSAPMGGDCAISDRIEVSYGEPGGFPSEPTAIGQLAGVTQLAPVYSQSPIDGLQDLAIATSCSPPGDDQPATALVLGNPGRELVTPFRFGLLEPHGLFAVDLTTESPGADHLVAAGNEGGPRAVVFPLAGDADLAMPVLEIDLAPASSFDTNRPPALAVNTSRPGAFVIGTIEAEDSRALRLRAYELPGSAPTHQDVIAELDTTDAVRWRIVHAPLGEARDRFVVVATSYLATPPLGFEPDVVEAESWAGIVEARAGGFDVVEVLGFEDETFTDVATFVGEGLEVVAVVSTNRGVYRLASNGSLDALWTVEPATSGATPGDLLSTIMGLASGDFDADGLDDLVVMQMGGARIHPQRPYQASDLPTLDPE